MKVQVLAVLLVAIVAQANEWWDPMGIMGGRQDQPVLAKMTPALQKNVPQTVQRQLARVTAKDLLGVRAIAAKLAAKPSSRAEFVKELNSKAPNVLFLGTEVYKVGHDTYSGVRKSLSSDSIKFLKNVVAETGAAVKEASALFNKQDVMTKKNLANVFPFIPQLQSSANTAVTYVSKNI